MGLSAVVYTNRRNLKTNVIDDKYLEVDKETGEIFIIDEANLNLNLPEEFFVAISYRIGNVSTVNHLHKEISRVLSEGSVILGKILYSGSHCGDKLALSDLSILKTEIIFLKRELRNRSSILEAFTENMLELVKISEKEGNPIVFV
jgi:hypothetical protein